LSRIGLFPEMLARQVTVLLGTDGIAADILSAGRLMASLFRDARADQEIFPPQIVLELMTINPARAMGFSDFLGSLEAGKKADIVLHDTALPEWGPIFDCPTQLAFSAPPHGVHSVWIDGRRVLKDGRSTMLDEEKLIADVQEAGRALIARTGLPNRTTWPVL
jgi:cytosine/adenosine deaminase-related metal-dependent hydrolase